MKTFLLAASVLVSVSTPIFAIDMSRDIDAATVKVMPKVIEWRRHIHRYPELSNRETKTAKFVEDHLRKLGMEVRTGVAKTGVIGILKGAQPGPVIGLRADMDALPVTERNSLPFASKETAEFNGQKVGVMHACGHDSHVAMLMGAAEILSAMKDKIKGTVVFILFFSGDRGEVIVFGSGKKLQRVDQQESSRDAGQRIERPSRHLLEN